MNRLSNREREVLIVIAQGLTAKEAAQHLHIDFRTIEKHLSCARHKLSAKNTIHAIVLALLSAEITLQHYS